MSLTDYACFQHLRKAIPDTINRMEAARKKVNELEARRISEILVYLHRVQKDWPAARKAADAARNKELFNDIAWEANDWKALAELSEADELRGADSRGEAAAYHRLAGNKAEYDKIMTELRKDLAGVEGDDAAAFTLAHALLLNGQGADAVAVLKDRPKRQPELVFDMLCAQLKFKEAFELANQVAKELEKDEENAFRRDELDLQKAKVLAGLGDRDAATQVFRGVFDRALTGERFRIGSSTSLNAIKAVARSGMRDLAAECTARILVQQEKQGSGDVIVGFLDPIFDENKVAAQVWWAAFRREAPDAEAGVTMARVLEFADGKADRKKVDHLVEIAQKLLYRGRGDDKLDDTIFQIPQGQIDYAIAEAYRIAGVKDKAEEFYKKAADTGMPGVVTPQPEEPDDFSDDDSPIPLPPRYRYFIAYADFLLAQKRFKEASELYRKTWDLTPSQPLPLFMHGFALTKLGDEREGKRLMELAHWVPLGSDSTRTRFADDLSGRGFDTDSRREMDLILNTSWFRTHHYGNALLREARTKSRAKDYATAAMYYEKDVISLFRTGAHFIEPKAYLTVPELSRTYRARALFAAGKIDEAMTEVRAGLKALPGNVEVAIGFVPDLERAGKKKEADEVYEKVKSAFDAALKDFGNSPDLRNSIAWTMVNCNRDLDEALKHAQKAVEQAPRAAGYIDTLAEIHFRKKDRVKALELMKQCATLEPHNPYFRKQLERFEKKPFDSPLPDEETGDD
jgi:tetratricopeptide (TPR) repeat protein